MKVNIGGTVYDSEKELIMVAFSEDEKRMISQMGNQKILASFPDDFPGRPDVLKIMEEFHKELSE